MGWPAPSASRVIVAGDLKDGRNQMQIAVLGIDLGKNSCSLVGLDGRGAVVKRRRMRPASVVGLTKALPPCIIAMEACCGAPRPAGGRAHRLDQSVARHSPGARHSHRPGAAYFERELDAMLCEEQGLAVSPRLRMLIEDMWEEWRVLDRRIAAFDDEFAARAKNDEAARRLATIPGIGVLNATALAAAIGEGQTFARGRDLAAWLGLVQTGRAIRFLKASCALRSLCGCRGRTDMLLKFSFFSSLPTLRSCN
jgi:transposase